MIQKKRYSLCILLFVFFGLIDNSFGQNKFWVFFKDKGKCEFNAFTYFDAKAIERRILQGLPAYDYTDLPVNESYLIKIASLADSVSKSTRWFNAVAAYANEKELEEIKALSFVSSVEPMFAANATLASLPSYNANLSEKDLKLLKMQTQRLGGNEFFKKNIDGKGIRIAIFDAGFPSVDKNPAFEDIRRENRIVKTYDFVKNAENVYGYNSHGTMVFSCIAGKTANERIGLATGAEFLLARTERATREPFSEEENWLAAVEWADKNGAQIINSSLGYTNNRYFIGDMNGRTSLVARAAELAAVKGILVVNAAGNEGNDTWKIIGTPADADSVLSIGGIDPETDFHIIFSSYGPTTDKRLKPNVCAYGHVIVSGEKGLTESFGTSFASPLIAGFAACAWQTNKGLKNMELFHEIEKSADLYPYFDYAHGYGVPQAYYFMEPKAIVPPSFDLTENYGILKVNIRDSLLHTSYKTVNDSIFTNPGLQDASNFNLLYYHIENKSGFLEKYYVIKVNEKNPINFILSDYKKGQTLMIHYRNYTQTYIF